MAQPPMFYQRSPDYESNMRMAQALMAQGGSTAPAATPLAALARVVQGGVGGFLQSRERDRDAARQKEYSTVLAQALQASEPWKNPDTSAVPGMNATERDATLGGGAGRRYLAPGEVAEGTGGPRAMIEVLMGNEMTAPLGTQMQFQDIQNRQETERLLAVERAKPRAPVSVPSGAALVDPVTGMPVYTAPVKREQFTVSVGSNEVTYTGDPTDQSTWQKVGEAPRFPPPAPSAPRTVTTAEGIFILRDDGTLGDRLGDPATNARGPMSVAPGGTVIDSATGQVVYQAPPSARNVQTATTGNGVFVVNPDGSLGQRLGDAPGATAKTPEEIRAEAKARAEGAAAGTPPKPQTPLEVLETRLGQMALDGELNTPEGMAALLNYQLLNGGKTLDQMRNEARVQAEGRAMGAAPVEPPRMNAVNVRMPDGSLVSGRETVQGEIEVRDSNGIWVLAPTEATRVGLTIQADNTSGLDNVQRRKVSDSIAASEGNIEELVTALTMLEQTPEATGVRGLAIDKVGGLLGQLPVVGPELESQLGTEQVQRVRTSLQALVGRFVRTITADESGRYSNADMVRVNSAMKATDPGASYTQVRNALETLLDIEKRSLGRDRGRLGGTGGASAGAVEVPTDPAQRVVGQVYMTPRGPATWSGTGWVLQNGGN